MCNCGNKRNAFAAPQPSRPGNPAMIKPQPAKMWPEASFEYTGNTALTVIGNVTGKRYRFSGKGDVQPVDYRDAGGMMRVPVLKKI